MTPEMETTRPPDLLTPRQFNPDHPPERPRPVYQIGDSVISSVGNLFNVQALPKAGKSSFLAALIAAPIVGNRIGPDTFGFTAENPEGKALIHIDTEQSAFDHDQLVRRALLRAKTGDVPPWLMSYCLTDLSIADRKKALLDAIELANETHGGIFAILIDGIADLCADPNDPAEAFALVGWIHTLAMANQCAIGTVLHENPGSDSGKTRGHLGSQLERKAETNLRLAKDSNGITSIWAERARHCHLPKDSAVCFHFSTEAGMHVSCGDAKEIKSAAIREKLQAEADKAFGGEEVMSYTELVDATMKAFTILERAAKGRVSKWASEGITTKTTDGRYRIS